MGTQGIPWIPDREKIKKDIVECHGLLTYVAKRSGVCRTTMNKLLAEDAELKKLLDEERQNFTPHGLDIAEKTLLDAMGEEQDISNRLRSAFYFLNNKGRERGYNPPSNTTNVQLTDAIAQANAIADQIMMRRLDKTKENCVEDGD